MRSSLLFLGWLHNIHYIHARGVRREQRESASVWSSIERQEIIVVMYCTQQERESHRIQISAVILDNFNHNLAEMSKSVAHFPAAGSKKKRARKHPYPFYSTHRGGCRHAERGKRGDGGWLAAKKLKRALKKREKERASERAGRRFLGCDRENNMVVVCNVSWRLAFYSIGSCTTLCIPVSLRANPLAKLRGYREAETDKGALVQQDAVPRCPDLMTKRPPDCRRNQEEKRSI